MSGPGASEPKTRRERLAAIADEYTEQVDDPRTDAVLFRGQPVPRYAAVTSEGSPKSARASRGNLLVAYSTGELAELLGEECGEGWLAHGRAWDLDAPWHARGNLKVAYPVRLGRDAASTVHAVFVAGPDDTVHLFSDRPQAELFAAALRRHGGEPTLTTGTLHDHRAAGRPTGAGRDRRPAPPAGRATRKP